MPSLPPFARELARRIAGARQLGQLARTEPVLSLVRERGSGTLLDVGSGALGLADFLDDRWAVTALDVSFGDYGAWSRPPSTRATRVTGDVRDLPFPDGAFDVVVAVDLLEHIAPADRARALGELARVARVRTIVAAPAGTPALEADRRLAGSLATPPPWLEEHLALGFPEPEELRDGLAPFGSVRLAGNENVDAHVTITRRELSLPWFAPTRTAARLLGWGMRRGAAWPGRVLRRLRGHDRGPTYRTIAVLEVERGATG
jgi:SAM-dependent methyltransferase